MQIETGKQERAGLYRYDGGNDADIKRLLNYDVPYDIADRVLLQLFETHVAEAAHFARGLYLTPAMIQEMSAGGMTFGAHGRNHRVFSRLDAVTQRQELEQGLPLIRSLTGQNAIPFCYPYGHPHTYTTDTLSLLRELSYSSAHTTVRSRQDFPAPDPYQLPRYDTKDLPPFTDYHA